MINGILNIYKPQNVSSNFMVVKVRKILGIKKVGHTGTLDPLACGVLPMCLGNATKISEYLIEKDKVYVVNIKFGILTDTYDLEGKVIKEDLDIDVSFEKLKMVLESFVGEYYQTPPIYSAIKVNGKRAYDLAREGIDITLKPRKVRIYYINKVEFLGKNEFSFEVKCSKGTYIRSLCKDIGDKLDTCATMTFLERIESGMFTKNDSIQLDELSKDNVCEKLISIEDVLDFPPLVVSDKNFYKLLINGVCVKNPMYIGNIKNGMYFLYSDDNVVGLCERNSDFLKIVKIFN